MIDDMLMNMKWRCIDDVCQCMIDVNIDRYSSLLSLMFIFITHYVDESNDYTI